MSTRPAMSCRMANVRSQDRLARGYTVELGTCSLARSLLLVRLRACVHACMPACLLTCLRACRACVCVCVSACLRVGTVA
jgi:hypothetical protein